MKFNWGTGIFIFIVLFIATCLLFLWYTSNMKISLVEEDYYPKELRHEEHMNKIRNANALSDRIHIVVAKDQVSLTMPKEMHGKLVKGQIHVYRPSDETKDLVLPLSPDTAGIQIISRARFSVGMYIIKIDWALEKTAFYQETEIYIP